MLKIIIFAAIFVMIGASFSTSIKQYLTFLPSN
jgi:hypothetical protein